MTDPIADMFTRLRNAGMAGKTLVEVPYSDLKLRIANLLAKEGFVGEVVRKEKKGSVLRVLEIGVLYDGPRAPRIRGIERVSRSSSRVYVGVTDLRPVRQGHGIAILSTPKGLLTDRDARKEHVGGEIIGKIW